MTNTIKEMRKAINNHVDSLSNRTRGTIFVKTVGYKWITERDDFHGITIKTSIEDYYYNLPDLWK